MAETGYMAELPAAPRASLWFWSFLFLAGALSSTILLKIAQIQYLELLYLFQLFLLVLAVLTDHLRFRVMRFSLRLAILYAVFALSSVVLSLVVRRNGFYLPAEVSFLKSPVVVTVSRVVELTVDVVAMLYFADVFRSNPKALFFTLRVYFWVGMLGVAYSFATFPLNVLHIASLGTYSTDHRMRGFYNEGGPYGLYLLTLIMVGAAMYILNLSKRSHLLTAGGFLIVAFIQSRSKAAICAAALTAVINALLVRGKVKKVMVLGVFAIVLAIGVKVVNLAAQLQRFRRTSADYEVLSNHMSRDDGNYVYGRVAGLFILPRMIAAHPLIGIGWGNYGLVRNAPEYRGASAWVTFNDNGGALGLIDLLANLGVPLTLLLLFCIFYPFFHLRSMRCPLYIQNLALLQPVVIIFGGQLNLTYPWLVTAFALGLGYLHAGGLLRPQLSRAPATSDPLHPAVMVRTQSSAI